jgi:uncharacterized protein (DUF1810 family)
MDNLQRFIDAQDHYYDTALNEMKAGKKQSHWIWFIFPQLSGLGKSYSSQQYGIEGAEEAKAYLAHPVLGTRLKEITAVVLDHSDKDINSIMGARIDAKKFKSSMTLFDAVCPNEIFAKALDTFFSGRRDSNTLKRL